MIAGRVSALLRSPVKSMGGEELEAVGRRCAPRRGGGPPLAIGPEGDVPHHDESPVHLLTTAGGRSLGQLLGRPVDVARFRPDVVLEAQGEGFP